MRSCDFPARFVLIRPRNPNNIGAVARAMANFGLADLRVVDPYPPVWNEAVSAVGAEEVLKNARLEPLKAAIHGCSLALGTGDGRRKPQHPIVPLPSLSSYLNDQGQGEHPIAVLFGSEKTGLRNEDLQFCRAVVRIPTTAQTPSMNLGQAAAVIAYELTRNARAEPVRTPKQIPPTVEQLDDLTRKTVTAFDRLNYMSNTDQSAKTDRVRRMLNRWSLDQKDAALLQAVFKRVGEISTGENT